MELWEELVRDLDSVGIDARSSAQARRIIEMGWSKASDIQTSKTRNVFDTPQQETLFDGTN